MTGATLPGFVAKPLVWAVQASARFVRPMTLGVRVVILDAEDRVFLVRHSYVPGWHCPGGGIEPGETAREAMIREVREEAGLLVDGASAALHGICFNRAMANRDHVMVYVVRRFRALPQPPSDWEIVERGFFPHDALPEGTTAGTRARLAEVLDGVPCAETW